MEIWRDRHHEQFRKEVERLRRGVQIVELKRAAGVQPPPEMRAFLKRFQRRVQGRRAAHGGRGSRCLAPEGRPKARSNNRTSGLATASAQSVTAYSGDVRKSYLPTP